jgi:putative radical SAM enzyme (TIGR03279 family)
MIRVARVLAGSIAEQLGILAGTQLLSVNGRQLADFLDWEFLTADEALEIEARLPDGEHVLFDVERSYGDVIGVELEPPRIRVCANRCEFCFIEGLPEGLRKPLYVRDDDYRLSFAYGNFATLSNVKERDIERILEYRLSPLYVSVHATPLDARRRLLNNRRVPDVLSQLRRLAAGGIQFHCQMVIVPGINDGAVLEQSLADLWALGDAVRTVAVVPVGLTQFSHLYTGRAMEPALARGLLAQVEPWERRAIAERGEGWVYASDELYLIAGAPLPAASHYADFAQVENGVGAVAHLRLRLAERIATLPRLDGRRIGVVTGATMAGRTDLMPAMLDDLSAATGATFELIGAENSLFGPTIGTAGLLVGADIRRALADRHDLDLALIPAECINDRGLFLDEVSFVDVRESLPMPVYPSYDFADVLDGEHTQVASAVRQESGS